jgi:hypothetical protein
VGGPAAGSTTGGGLAVSPEGSTTALVDAQPITTMQNTTMHPHTVAERTRLTVLIRPPARRAFLCIEPRVVGSIPGLIVIHRAHNPLGIMRAVFAQAG